MIQVERPIEVAVTMTSPKNPVGSQSELLVYLVALAIGLGVALYMVPVRLMLAQNPFAQPLAGDVAQNVIGQRYYLADSWHWPLLVAKGLVAPDGTNIAFMDAIPLVLIPLKIIRRFLPPGFQAVYLWLAFCWVMQPVAAVFALRSAGERRFLPGLAAGVISISMPTLLYRYGHVALSSHFLILFALGLYFQIVREPGRKPLLWAAVLMVCSLLVHPYIMCMVIAVLSAAPLTLLVRTDRRWLPTAIGIAGGIAVAALMAVLLGYGHAAPMAGFGYYSMNLLSPIYPLGSSILRGFKDPLDATGGQGEGYQYLGLDVLSMIVLCDCLLGPREKLKILLRNAGITAACLVLTLLALSNKVYAGHELLWSIGPGDLMFQFRGSGRFFWPVAYVLTIGSIGLLCRYLPKRAWILLLLLALLQFVETGQMRRGVRHDLRAPASWVLNTQELRPLLAEHSSLSVWPKFLCGADHGAPPFLQLGLLASEIALPIDTAYVGRTTGSDSCRIPELPVRVNPGELLVLLPPRAAAMSHAVAGWNDICRQIGVLVACSQKLRGRSDLALPVAPEFPADQAVSTAAAGGGLPALGFGWYLPEPWGTWSEGTTAQMLLRPNSSTTQPLVLSMRANVLSPSAKEPQKVDVWVDGKLSATWQISSGTDRQYSVPIPPRASTNVPVSITLHIEHPVMPKDLGFGNDSRKVGFGLISFDLEKPHTASQPAVP